MAVALYARVSTTRQAEKDLSIPDQLKQMRAYCAKQGWEVAEEYVEDGASATSDRRPVFQAMIAEACALPSAFDAIIVHSLSRFFRDAIEFGLYERKLSKFGVRLISLSQQTSDDSAGMLARRIFSVFDEFQSLENSKHTLRSMIENARQGFWNGAPPPFGYRAQATDAKGRHGMKKKLEIDPGEAEIVRLIYDLYAGRKPLETMGYKGIAAYLNGKGLLRRGKRWTHNQIHAALTDPVYIGELCFNRTHAKTQKLKPESEWIRVPVPAIIDERQRAETDAGRLARRRESVPPRQLASPLMLAGLLRCGVCGAGMTLATGKGGRYRYYKCNSRISKGSAVCDNNSLRVDGLDQAVVGAVVDRVLEPAHILALLSGLQQRARRSRGGEADRVDTLKKELAENKAATERLLDAVEKGLIPADETLQVRAHKLKARRQDLLIGIAGLSNRQAMPLSAISAATADKFSAAFRGILADPEAPLTKRYLRALVGRVTVTGREVAVEGPKAALALMLDMDGGVKLPSVPRSVEGWLPE